MILEIIQQLIDGDTDKIYEISRIGQSVSITWGWHQNRESAFAFQVDSKMKLCGFAIFGSKVENWNYVVAKVYNNSRSLQHKETLKFKSRGSTCPILLLFSKSLPIESNKLYHITTYVPASGGTTYYGQDFKQVVDSEDPDEGSLKVSFSRSHHEAEHNSHTYWPLLL